MVDCIIAIFDRPSDPQNTNGVSFYSGIILPSFEIDSPLPVLPFTLLIKSEFYDGLPVLKIQKNLRLSSGCSF